jgi:DNA repair exonuclease SbcCD ATPase subunit
MASFTIKILDEGGVITFLKVDHKQQIPIDYCSGFEKFAISIAIRIALAKIHPFNSMNSLFIDEGFGVFDSENLKRLPEMLEPLTNIFAQIFIITHIDDLQSALQHKITITNDSKGFPTINY